MINIAINSTKDEIEKRLSNPFWGSFIISWIIVNWKVWYVTFFISEITIKENKIDYILSLYMPEGLAIFKLLIFPLVMSAISIYFIPFISDEYLKKQKKNKESETRITNTKELIDEIKIETDLENQKITQLEKLVKGKEKSSKLIQKTQELSGNLDWDKDYDKFTEKYSGMLDRFSFLIYKAEGSFFTYNKNYGDKAQLLEAIDLFNLIKDTQSGKNIEYSDKGKYFLKKYSESK